MRSEKSWVACLMAGMIFDLGHVNEGLKIQQHDTWHDLGIGLGIFNM